MIVGVPAIVSIRLHASAETEIKAAVRAWGDSWNKDDGGASRTALTCLARRTPGAPETRPQGVQITAQAWSGSMEQQISLTLDTAYSPGSVSGRTSDDTSAEYISESVGFELVKENGNWKVCDWGKDVADRRRTSILGWKLSGPPA
ncbi:MULTISPECIES: hypothetical protein [Tsukamurella]|uniref:Uncharacterized protein n=2 Tax=Tsukamurella TaxID=2060 RepID=A0A846X5S8_9ACTN|nr:MULTISPECIES: hypothetical protein [Tsukamurella]NKY20794.1 hypothetical protein [Tsukamurella spumae]